MKGNEWKTKEMQRKHEEVEKEMTIVSRTSNENEMIWKEIKENDKKMKLNENKQSKRRKESKRKRKNAE